MIGTLVFNIIIDLSLSLSLSLSIYIYVCMSDMINRHISFQLYTVCFVFKSSVLRLSRKFDLYLNGQFCA